jgi:hypothetical protein
MFGCHVEGMTATQLRVDEVDAHEMASTESELSETHPGVAPDVIRLLVEQAYARMTPAKVHNYLPILVGREVRDELRATRVA